MKKMAKTILCIALSIVMLISAAPFTGFSQLTFRASAEEITASGTCGDNLTWTLSGSTLTIDGTGKMDDYGYFENNYSPTPWFEYSGSIESIIINDGVTSIGDCAFFDITMLTSITIPDSVTSIGRSAFWWCTFIKNIDIPDSVTSIGEGAFEGCHALTSITIPKSVTSIEGNVFSYCTSLTNIYVDKNNPSYSSTDGILYNKDKTVLICYPIEKPAQHFVIPDSVKNIGNCSFAYSHLTSITIPSNTKSIGEHAFAECKSLKNITISNGVTSIGDYAFACCYALDSINIPDSVEAIGDKAFASCYSLDSINIPDSVEAIGDSPFTNCSLQEIIVGTKNSNYSSHDGILYNKDKTELICYPTKKTATSFVIPHGVTNISNSAFYDCYSLTSITIPNSVTSIGNSAFYYCESLSNITIPDSVTSIGNEAFAACFDLTSITILNPYCEIYDDEYIIYSAATITGYEGSTAQAYAEKYEREFVSLGKYVHTHSYEETITTKATCKNEGVKTFTCECGDEYTEKIPVLTTHTWGSWAVAEKPTYEKEGKEERSCTVCKKSESRAIAKLEIKDIEFNNTESAITLGDNAMLLPDITIEEMLSKTQGNITVTDKDGNTVNATDTVKSGMTITLKDKNGNTVDTKTIVVPGDNDGDGKISATDARTALRASVKLDNLNVWQNAASDVSEREKAEITAADARYILRASVKLEDVSLLLKSLK